jgi:uncharacterized protein
MIYRNFGNTGIKISSLGFGCMRLPMIDVNGKKVIDQEKVSAMLQRAYELGVNYFDSAYFYNNGLSEGAMGKAIKQFRHKVYVSTKSPGHLNKKPGDYRRILEEQLQRLDVDYVDFYHFHGIGYENFLSTDKNSGWIDDAAKAKSDGLIKHICFSFHDKAENMMKLIDLGLFESVLCQYSVVDRANEAAIAYAKQKGLGVIVMGPLGGGRVTGLPEQLRSTLGIQVKSNAELALRFVFANPNIDCALSGMEKYHQVEENATISAQRTPLSTDEVIAIRDMMQENEKLSDLYCTGCSYCMPCPSAVNIPHIFRMMNYYKIYGIIDYARNGYAEIGISPWVPGTRADECSECGACEELCPQKIHIIEQLKDCHATLSACL